MAARRRASSSRTEAHRAWDPVASSLAYWACCARSTEIWWTRRGGAGTVADRRADRLAALLATARERSPFYRAHFQRLPGSGGSLADFPVVTKRELMAHFDAWATDPAITLEAVRSFLVDRAHIGEKFLGRYFVWKSSGSSGLPGIFVQDSDAVTVYDALVLAHLDLSTWGANAAGRMLGGTGRAALIVATTDHFASIASWQRARRANPGLQAHSFSVLTPMPELVDALNAYQPTFLASYPTVLRLLAREQRSGRLHIAPASLWSGGECLTRPAHESIERAFGCVLTNEYGASECLSIAYECPSGSLHVNADWVLLEPVDASYRPTPPGVLSHTVLLTNLANRVQPIIRYDLGDSILVHRQPCSCGSPLPVIEVHGRSDAILVLRARDGRTVPIAPLALDTVIEEATALHPYQLVQTGPDRLILRLPVEIGEASRRRALRAVEAALRDFLAAQGLPNVGFGLDAAAPRPRRPGGKMQFVCRADRGESLH